MKDAEHIEYSIDHLNGPIPFKQIVKEEKK
jgi:hypothetical protein